MSVEHKPLASWSLLEERPLPPGKAGLLGEAVTELLMWRKVPPRRSACSRLEAEAQVSLEALLVLGSPMDM